jgi:hypothetical protein
MFRWIIVHAPQSNERSVIRAFGTLVHAFVEFLAFHSIFAFRRVVYSALPFVEGEVISDLAAQLFTSNVEHVFTRLALEKAQYAYAPKHHPIKVVPVNGQNLNVDNIRAIHLTDIATINWRKYDLVILATGYSNRDQLKIFVDNHRTKIGMFYLNEQICHYKAPNLFYCVPSGTSCYHSLQGLYRGIRCMLESNAATINKHDHVAYKRKVKKRLADLHLTKEQYKWHCKVNVFQSSHF